MRLRDVNWGRLAVYAVLAAFCFVWWVGLVTICRWIVSN